MPGMLCCDCIVANAFEGWALEKSEHMSADPLEGGYPPRAAAVAWGWVPPLWINCQLLLLLRGGQDDIQVRQVLLS